MKRAFTLIELLIVVAIIAILAAIAVPNFLEAQVRAKVSRINADMRSLATAIEAYSVDYNTPPLILPPPFGTWETRPYRAFDYWMWGYATGTSTYAFAATPFTTPVAYTTSLPPDPFCGPREGEHGTWTRGSVGVFYLNVVGACKARISGVSMGVDAALDPTLSAPAPVRMVGVNDSVRQVNWMMLSVGPDKDYNVMPSGGSSLQQLFPAFATGRYVTHFLNGDKLPYDATNGTMSEGNIYKLSD